MGVHGDLVLCGVTNQTLIVGEGDIGWGGSVTLVVGDDFDTIVLPDTDATEKKYEMEHMEQTGNLRVGGAEIDTDGFG